jgi:hypothetical protein
MRNQTNQFVFYLGLTVVLLMSSRLLATPTPGPTAPAQLSPELYTVYHLDGTATLTGQLGMRFTQKANAIEGHAKDGFHSIPVEDVTALVPSREPRWATVITDRGYAVYMQLLQPVTLTPDDGILRNVDLRRIKIIRRPYPEELTTSRSAPR